MPLQKTTREEIIKSSIQVLRRKGYYRTSMNDLAKGVGLTKGVFYHHFSNKEEVMRVSLQATTNWFEIKVFSIAYLDNLSNREKLVKMADVTFAAFTDNAGGCFFSNTILETAHVEDTFLKEITHFFTLWEKAFLNIFEEKYSVPENRDVVHQVIADIEGSIILMQLHRDTSFLRKALQRSIGRL